MNVRNYFIPVNSTYLNEKGIFPGKYKVRILKRKNITRINFYLLNRMDLYFKIFRKRKFIHIENYKILLREIKKILSNGT